MRVAGRLSAQRISQSMGICNSFRSLIKLGESARVFFMRSQSGYDTHSQQADTVHRRLLTDFSGAAASLSSKI